MEAILPLLQALSTTVDVRPVLHRRFDMPRWFLSQVSIPAVLLSIGREAHSIEGVIQQLNFHDGCARSVAVLHGRMRALATTIFPGGQTVFCQLLLTIPEAWR